MQCIEKKAAVHLHSSPATPDQEIRLFSQDAWGLVRHGMRLAIAQLTPAFAVGSDAVAFAARKPPLLLFCSSLDGARCQTRDDLPLEHQY